MRYYENNYANNKYKKKFSMEAGKHYNWEEFLEYCMYMIAYHNPITLRKLKNHFSDKLIDFALDKHYIVPHKDNPDCYFFTAFKYCKEHGIGVLKRI